MHNKQRAEGTTPVVRLMKKSACHSVAFDTNMNVPVVRENTKQFAPRRSLSVLIDHIGITKGPVLCGGLGCGGSTQLVVPLGRSIQRLGTRHPTGGARRKVDRYAA